MAYREELIPITLAKVEAMSPLVSSYYDANPGQIEAMAWNHLFFGRGDLITTTDSSTPAAASLGKRYRLTRVDLHARPEGANFIMTRCHGATVSIATEPDSTDWTQSSEWSSFVTMPSAANTALLADGWQRLVGTPAVGYHVKVEGGQYGNYFIRLWGVPMDVGTAILIH